MSNIILQKKKNEKINLKYWVFVQRYKKDKMRGKVLIRYFEKLMRCKMWDHEIFKDGLKEEEEVVDDGWLWFDKKRDKHCFILYHK